MLQAENLKTKDDYMGAPLHKTFITVCELCCELPAKSAYCTYMSQFQTCCKSQAGNPQMALSGAGKELRYKMALATSDVQAVGNECYQDDWPSH
jgi:hypothetical protein